MTAVTLRLPVVAGSAVAAGSARILLWGYGYIARAPLASAAIAIMVGLSATAYANALYFQSGPHPSPMFTTQSPIAESAAPEPALTGQPVVIPAQRTEPIVRLPPVSEEVTASTQPAQPLEIAPTGNPDVFEVQKKLYELKFFTGKVDGYYGPQTAQAIRAFEQANGFTPEGAMTPAIIEAIRAASSTQPVVLREQAPLNTLTAPQARQTLTTPQQPLAAIVATQPAPQPLVTGSTQPMPEALPQQATLVGQAGPEDYFDQAAQGAEEVLDNVASAVLDLNAQRGANLPAATTTAAANPPAPLANATLPSTTNPDALQPATDPTLVAKVQRGLASLGFLHGAVDGVAGEATARAIRNFEVYYNYQVTGEVTPALLDILVSRGAVI